MRMATLHWRDSCHWHELALLDQFQSGQSSDKVPFHFINTCFAGGFVFLHAGKKAPNSLEFSQIFTCMYAQAPPVKQGIALLIPRYRTLAVAIHSLFTFFCRSLSQYTKALSRLG